MMPGENENILIRVVDDDAHMRGSLEFMLTAEGFAVKTYPSAQAFLTDDAPSRPGCLILDVKMDRMTGLEHQEEKIRRSIRLPEVFMSGRGRCPLELVDAHGNRRRQASRQRAFKP